MYASAGCFVCTHRITQDLASTKWQNVLMRTAGHAKKDFPIIHFCLSPPIYLLLLFQSFSSLFLFVCPSLSFPLSMSFSLSPSHCPHPSSLSLSLTHIHCHVFYIWQTLKSCQGDMRCGAVLVVLCYLPYGQQLVKVN